MNKKRRITLKDTDTVRLWLEAFPAIAEGVARYANE